MTRFHVLLSLSCAVLLVVGTAATSAGGFELRAEQPATDGAVLVVRAFGCHQPEQAKVTGTAEGLVDGTRRSVPVTLKATGKGVYDVVWEQPTEGTWVLALTGTYRGQVSSLLVEVDDQGQAVLPAPDASGRRIQPLQRSLTTADVEHALNRQAHTG